LITIREERPEDVEAIRAVNQETFGQPQEGQLIDALRANGGVALSLVATLNDRVVGHIAYSSVSVGPDAENIVGAGLGPMGVLPEYQRRGIGTKLVETGNEILRDRGCSIIVVLGHPEYYPRFGFKPASGFGLRCEWDVPDQAFMALVFDPAKMKRVSGLVKYRPEFSSIA
jgi:putative acetyltransferase